MYQFYLSRAGRLLCLFVLVIVAVSNANAQVSLLSEPQPLSRELAAKVRKGNLYQFNKIAARNIMGRSATAAEMSFRFEDRNVVVDVEPSEIFSKGFFVRDAAGNNVPYDQNATRHYHGKIRGEARSLVAFTITENRIVGVISDAKGNINIGPVGDDLSGNSPIILYRDQDLIQQPAFNCFTPAGGDTDNLLPEFAPSIPENAVINDEPIDIYFEADYKSYQNNSTNIINTANWVAAVFNVVTTLYENDSIKVRMSGIKVWNAPDPYMAGTSTATDVLNKFGPAMNSGFPGDLAHLVSQRSLGGGVAYLKTLCGGPSSRTGVSGNMTNSFNQLPAYSWDVMVVTHETGHNIGSNHTQSCTWPGGAIDNCYAVEGSCSQGPAPVNGGTIMSYCHLTGYGINLMNGFGPLPGAFIRNVVRTSPTCIVPRINFDRPIDAVIEEDANIADGCHDYQLISVKLSCNYAPTIPAEVDIVPVLMGGMALGEGKDVSLSTTHVTFTDTTPAIIVLKVYDDARIEGLERIRLDPLILPNGSNAIKYGSYTLTLTSLDHAPDSTAGMPLYAETFDGVVNGLGPWTENLVYGNTSPNRWRVGVSGDAAFATQALFISSNGNTASYAGNSLADSTVTRAISPTIGATGFKNLKLTFQWKCFGEGLAGQGTIGGEGAGYDFGKLLYSVDNGNTWALLKDKMFGRNFKYFETLLLPALANNQSAIKLAFEWQNNSSTVNNPPLIIDSLVLSGTAHTPIQSLADIGNTRKEYLGPYDTVHFYNPGTKLIMASVINKSAHDFGCVTISINRTGDSANKAWGDYPEEKLASKTYRLVADNPDAVSNYQMIIYYTESELNGWMNATGNNSTEARVIQSATDITIVPPAYAPSFGSGQSMNSYTNIGKKFSGIFTGNAFFGLGKPGVTTACDGGTIMLTARETGNAFQWQVDDGSGYINLSNSSEYAGINNDTLTINAAPTSWYGYSYRCLVTDANGTHYNIEYKLKFSQTWLGTVSKNWEDAGNWSCNTVPDENTDVFIKPGAPQYPDVNTNTSIRSLVMQEGSAVNVKAGVSFIIMK